jgi:hypothetical protein
MRFPWKRTRVATDVLESANAFTGEQALRTFQRQILAHGAFSITSPFTGKTVTASANFCFPNEAMLYRFDEGEGFVLVSASLRFGYPIIALVTPQQTTEIFPRAPLPPRLKDKALEILREGHGHLVNPSLPPQAITGHKNFAHHLWNEFPALTEARDLGNDFRVVGLYDSLGVLEPYCRANALHFVEGQESDLRPGWRDNPSTFIGSQYCGTQAKRELMQLCLRTPPGPRDGYPRLYVTVRGSIRTLKSQEVFLSELVREAFNAWPEARIIFDGFSLPMDYSLPRYDRSRSDFEHRLKEANAIIRACTAALDATQRKRVQNLTGLPLQQALAVIQSCDYYVCHTGTMQHKIGWLFNIPGYMHGNQASISKASVKWYANQVAGSSTPCVPESEMIRDLDVNPEAPNINERNRDYDFPDVGLVVRHIVADMQTRLRSDLAP